MEERTVARLRRTAAAVYPRHAEVSAFLRGHRVRVVEHGDLGSALAWAHKHPFAPLLIYDPGRLDRALFVASRLDETMTPRPVLVVISDALDQGLAELGWTRSTWRIGFARTQYLETDLEVALDELMHAEPELPADVIDRERTPDEGDDEPLFDVGALAGELRDRCAWAGALVERVGRSLELHASIDDAFEGRLAAAWQNDEAKRLELSFVAALPPGLGSFAVWARRDVANPFGIPAVLRVPGLDDAEFDAAFELRPGDENGLDEARTVGATLVEAPRALDELAVGFEQMNARAGRVPREDVVDVAGWLLELWRVLLRSRLLRG